MPTLSERHHINPGESKAWANSVGGTSTGPAGVTVLEGLTSAVAPPPGPVDASGVTVLAAVGETVGAMVGDGVAAPPGPDRPPVAAATGVLVTAAIVGAALVTAVIKRTVGTGVSPPAGLD